MFLAGLATAQNDPNWVMVAPNVPKDVPFHLASNVRGHQGNVRPRHRTASTVDETVGGEGTLQHIEVSSCQNFFQGLSGTVPLTPVAQ